MAAGRPAGSSPSTPSASHAEPEENGYTRTIPEAVMRQLRQEVGFGCAKCGHPYIEYHHIVPFSEEAHHRPEDMMAVCGNCHPAVSTPDLRAHISPRRRAPSARA